MAGRFKKVNGLNRVNHIYFTYQNDQSLGISYVYKVIRFSRGILATKAANLMKLVVYRAHLIEIRFLKSTFF